MVPAFQSSLSVYVFNWKIKNINTGLLLKGMYYFLPILLVCVCARTHVYVLILSVFLVLIALLFLCSLFFPVASWLCWSFSSWIPPTAIYSWLSGHKFPVCTNLGKVLCLSYRKDNFSLHWNLGWQALSLRVWNVPFYAILELIFLLSVLLLLPWICLNLWLGASLEASFFYSLCNYYFNILIVNLLFLVCLTL